MRMETTKKIRDPFTSPDIGPDPLSLFFSFTPNLYANLKNFTCLGPEKKPWEFPKAFDFQKMLKPCSKMQVLLSCSFSSAVKMQKLNFISNLKKQNCK